MKNHFRSAIRLEFVDDCDYEKTELDIIHALSLQKNSSYKILDKKLTKHNGKMYDIIKVGFTGHSAQSKNVITVEILYFDVSSFWGE
jgi:hypothetical protein